MHESIEAACPYAMFLLSLTYPYCLNKLEFLYLLKNTAENDGTKSTKKASAPGFRVEVMD